MAGQPSGSGVVLLLGLFLLSSAGANSENAFCFRCHRMETLGYLDPETGELVSLFVDPVAFGRSNHRELSCVDCHDPGFGEYPHPSSLQAERLDCRNCHQENQELAEYRFPELIEEFQASVHVRKLGDRFSCFSCHEPHLFRVTRQEPNVQRVVETDNGICLSCHASPITFRALTDREFPELIRSHRWLPNAQLHWRHVRCVECHTPHTERLSHRILPAEEAEQNCVACHSRNSILLTKLYRHRTQEARERLGFVNSVILNDAYLVGATRNLLLDRLSVVLFGLTVLGLGLHGMGRWLARRRQGGR
ncbi:MAG: hypothetical protein KatS3mg115_1894 [Candidatus Poribacteria bacterium]|nr:MAG: hypothetical protein KatS3mg115_1894 [Candidatus Poribacteria bacterium]